MKNYSKLASESEVVVVICIKRACIWCRSLSLKVVIINHYQSQNRLSQQVVTRRTKAKGKGGNRKMYKDFDFSTTLDTFGKQKLMKQRVKLMTFSIR